MLRGARYVPMSRPASVCRAFVVPYHLCYRLAFLNRTVGPQWVRCTKATAGALGVLSAYGWARASGATLCMARVGRGVMLTLSSVGEPSPSESIGEPLQDHRTTLVAAG